MFSSVLLVRGRGVRKMGLMLHVNNWLHSWCQQQGFGLQETQSDISVCLGEIGTKSQSWAKVFLLTRCIRSAPYTLGTMWEGENYQLPSERMMDRFDMKRA